MREIAIAMAVNYPAMFKYRPVSDGMRAVDKVDIQAGKMCDRVCYIPIVSCEINNCFPSIARGHAVLLPEMPRLVGMKVGLLGQEDQADQADP